MTGIDPSPWLLPVGDADEAPDRAGGKVVFCPPAGGSASAAWQLAGAVGASRSLWGVQYPARGPRLREPQPTSIREISAACLPDLLADADRTVLFGHSFGAYVAYDLAQLLERRGHPAAGLVVAGVPAPGTSLPDLSPDDLSDAALVESLSSQGGTSPELLASEELMRLVLPAVRADLALGRTYVDDHERRLATAVVAIGGRDDRSASRELLATWAHVTDSWLGQESAAGGHFFYQQDPALLGAVLDRHWPRPTLSVG